MRVTLRALLVLLAVLPMTAGEALASFLKHNVAVELSIEPGDKPDQQILVGRFTPKPKGEPLHLYSVDLKADAGVATRIDLAPDQTVKSAGPHTADKVPHDLDGVSVYPDGVVVVRHPITVPITTDGAPIETVVLVSYMACSKNFCMQPLMNEKVTIKVPSRQGQSAP